jgi:hypothetical protein
VRDKMLNKIKRLSASYRKHEKGIEELKLKQMIEGVKMVLAITNSIVQMQIIAKQPKCPEGLATGGVVSGLKPEICGEQRDHVTVVNKGVLDNIKSHVEASSNGKINVKIYPSIIAKDKVN